MAKKQHEKAAPVELREDQLDDAQGGLIGLLLPAVQKVRDAAARPSTTGGVHVAVGDVNGDG